MKKKGLWITGVMVVLVLGGGFYFTPYWSVYAMKKAAERGDAETLSEYVDYPALRESIKSNLGTLLSETFGADKLAANPKVKEGKEGEEAQAPKGKGDSGPAGKGQDLLGAMGGTFFTAMLNPLVDSFVTPENLAKFLQGRKPQVKKERAGPPGKQTDPPPAEGTAVPDMKTEISMGYKGFSRFVVNVKGDAATKDGIDLLFKRDNLLFWRLSGISFKL